MLEKCMLVKIMYFLKCFIFLFFSSEKSYFSYFYFSIIIIIIFTFSIFLSLYQAKSKFFKYAR